jgi:hypothetical protein
MHLKRGAGDTTGKWRAAEALLLIRVPEPLTAVLDFLIICIYNDYKNQSMR